MKKIFMIAFLFSNLCMAIGPIWPGPNDDDDIDPTTYSVDCGSVTAVVRQESVISYEFVVKINDSTLTGTDSPAQITLSCSWQSKSNPNPCRFRGGCLPVDGFTSVTGFFPVPRTLNTNLPAQLSVHTSKSKGNYTQKQSSYVTFLAFIEKIKSHQSFIALE